MSRFTTTCLCLFATSFVLAAPACDTDDDGHVDAVQPNFTPPYDPAPDDISAEPVDCVGDCDAKSCDDDDACAYNEFCDFGDACGGAGTCQIQPDACYRKLDPVCGCDGETYDNACIANLNGVSVAAAGECAGECVCTLEYAPVCGVDGTTYANSCAAGCAEVAVDYEGECTSGCEDNSQCGAGEFCQHEDSCGGAGTCAARPALCGELYEPVCGCDGETYGNACEANAAGVNVQAEDPCEAPQNEKLD